MEKLEEKVYIFVEPTKEVIKEDELFLIVNDRLMDVEGKKLKVKDLFVKIKVLKDMVVGYSPLATLELNEEGQLVSDKAKICFVGADGDQIRLKKVRNTIIQMNDKESNEQVDTLFKMLGNTDPLDDNDQIVKLRAAEYETIKNDDYVLMYKDTSEPYLFMKKDDGLIMLDMDEKYSNEDNKKFHINSIGKDLTLDLKEKAISVE